MAELEPDPDALRYVTRLARRLVRDPNLAEDLAQETWLVALARASRELSLRRAWLAVVLRSRVRNHFRAQGRRGEHGAAGPWHQAAERFSEIHMTRILLIRLFR